MRCILEILFLNCGFDGAVRDRPLPEVLKFAGGIEPVSGI